MEHRCAWKAACISCFNIKLVGERVIVAQCQSAVERSMFKIEGSIKLFEGLTLDSFIKTLSPTPQHSPASLSELHLPTSLAARGVGCLVLLI